MAADVGITCLMVTLVLGNMFAAAAGLALFALGTWVAVDNYQLYPIASVSGKDDIFAAAWIAIFTGFAFFCTAVFGVIVSVRKIHCLLMTYLILMLIIFMFECASCITAATHRDYLVGNSSLVKKQMLKYYTANSSSGSQITATWNRVMSQAQCCGTDGPTDWINYNSTFRQTFGPGYPWPLNCCKRNSNYEVTNLGACKVGQINYINSQGCFSYISSVFNLYTWAIAWYGFAVLMFVFFLLLLTMVYYVILF